MHAGWVVSMLALGSAAPGGGDQDHLTLVVSARSHGVSAHPTRMVQPALLHRLGATVSTVAVGYRALEHRGCVALALPGQDLGALLGAVADPNRQLHRTVAATAVFSSSDVVVAQDGSDATLLGHAHQAATTPGAPELTIQHVQLWWWQAAGQPLLMLAGHGCSREAANAHDVTQWEVRSVTLMHQRRAGAPPVVLHAISQPLGEGVRRHVLHQQVVASAHRAGTPVLELLLGGDIEGASYLHRQVNLHRGLTLEALAQRHPAVWVPQSAELHGGLRAFVHEAETVGAAPLSANLLTAGGSPALPGYRLFQVGRRVVAVIGVTDPAEEARLPPDVNRALQVADPAPAVAGALAASVADLGRWPDLVVVAGALSGGHAQAVAALPGVDVAYVTTVHSAEASAIQVNVPAATGRAARRPVLAPPLSPHRLEQTFVTLEDLSHGGGGMHLLHTAEPITLDAPVDASLEGRVQAVRQPIYVEGARVLVPDPTAVLSTGGVDASARALADVHGTRLGFGPALYGQVVGNAVLDHTGADVAVMPPPAEFWEAEGGFSALRLMAALQGQDVLVAAVVDADALRSVLARAPKVGASVAGASGQLVRGRPMDSRRRYLLVTTEQLAVALDLEGRVVARRWVSVGPRAFPLPGGVGGVSLSYRQVVMDRLVALGASSASARNAALAAQMRPRHDVVAPRLTLEARDLTLAFGAYDANGNERYPGVPYWRVTAPDNRSLLGSGTVRAAWETSDVSAEARFSARWDRLVFNRVTLLERANFWNFSAELRIPRLGLDLTRFHWRAEPFISQSAESQFFALPEPDPSVVFEWHGPRFFFGRTNLGVALLDLWFLREWRLSAVMQQDMVRLPETLKEPGRPYFLQAGVESSGLAAYEAGPLTLELTHSWRYFMPRPGLDGPRELSLWGMTRAAVKASIIPGVSVSCFTDAFVFLGPRPSDRPGLSYTLGIGLGMDRTYTPLSELAWLY